VTEKRKSYKQFCGIARALDRVGERWTLLIVRNLLLGPRRYSDLLAELPGITTNLLAKRLKEMAAQGLLEKREEGSIKIPVYALTPLGAALEPVLLELGRWGSQFMGTPSRSDLVNIAWGLFSLKRRYRGGRGHTVGFSISGRQFELELGVERLAVQERRPMRADLFVEGPLASFQGWLMRGLAPEALRASGQLSVRGDEAAWEDLIHAFEPPAPAARSRPRPPDAAALSGTIEHIK
jgi:DNA-binding HxlR family transcriptional regulator